MELCGPHVGLTNSVGRLGWERTYHDLDVAELRYCDVLYIYSMWVMLGYAHIYIYIEPVLYAII